MLVTNGPFANLTDRIAYGAWADTDNDGDLDLFLGTDPKQNPVFLLNQGNGEFSRVAVDQNWTSNKVQARGKAISWGDYDGDGFLDAFLGFYAADGATWESSLLHNNGDGSFSVVTDSILANSGVNEENSAWVDFDNDGHLDLFVTRSGGPLPSSLSDLRTRIKSDALRFDMTRFDFR